MVAVNQFTFVLLSYSPQYSYFPIWFYFQFFNERPAITGHNKQVHRSKQDLFPMEGSIQVYSPPSTIVSPIPLTSNHCLVASNCLSSFPPADTSLLFHSTPNSSHLTNLFKYPERKEICHEIFHYPIKLVLINVTTLFTL